jgi:alpha-L-fucosidase 2
MKEVALFYEEFFKQKIDGLYESYPSYSPDNTPSNLIDAGKGLEIARNSMIDFAVAKELLTNLINGCEETGLFKNEIDKWKDMLGRIPNYIVTEEGTVKEYLDTRLFDNHVTRSINQIYGIYPGTESIEKDPDLFKACLNTVRKRLTAGIREHNAQSLVRFANTFARLGDASSAVEALNILIRTCVMSNLVTANNDWRGMGLGETNAWAQYQLEGNMGFTSAVQEMLLNSREGSVKVFPALPADWSKGSISGLNTRAGVEVDLTWSKTSATVKIKARRNTTLDVLLPSNINKLKGCPSSAKFDPATYVVHGLEISGGRTVTLTYQVK